MRRTIGFLVAAALAVTGLTACMSDDNGSSARGERRSAALVAAGAQGSSVQLSIDTVTPVGQAIEVLDYSWGVEVPGGGVAQFEELTIKKTMDEVSPKLFETLAVGRSIPRAELKLYMNPGGRGQVNYATYTLEPAMIQSVQHSGEGSGQQLPTEQVSLGFTRIRLETRLPLDAQGQQGPRVVFGWDLAARRPWN